MDVIDVAAMPVHNFLQGLHYTFISWLWTLDLKKKKTAFLCQITFPFCFVCVSCRREKMFWYIAWLYNFSKMCSCIMSISFILYNKICCIYSLIRAMQYNQIKTFPSWQIIWVHVFSRTTLLSKTNGQLTWWFYCKRGLVLNVNCVSVLNWGLSFTLLLTTYCDIQFLQKKTKNPFRAHGTSQRCSVTSYVKNSFCIT